MKLWITLGDATAIGPDRSGSSLAASSRPSCVLEFGLEHPDEPIGALGGVSVFVGGSGGGKVSGECGLLLKRGVATAVHGVDSTASACAATRLYGGIP